MEYNILDNGWYQLPFTVEQNGDVFRDALVIPPEEYATLTPEAFAAIQQQRYDSWKAVIAQMSQDPVVNPTADPIANEVV